MSDCEEMLAVFKAGFRARFDAPGLLKPEGDEAIRAGIRAVVDALVGERDLWKSDADRQRQLREDDKAEVERLKGVLGEVKRRSQIDPGPLPHESQVLVKLQSCFEIARSALEAKP